MGGYLLIRCRSGLNDCIKILAYYTPYAKKHDRTILLEFIMYSATDLNDIFDFSDYPCKIIVNPKEILEKLVADNVEIVPAFYKSQILNPKDVKHTDKIGYCLYNKHVRINLNYTHSDSVLLVCDCGGYGIDDNYTYINKIKFNKKIIDLFNIIRKTFPVDYNSIHIRSTDLGRFVNKQDIIKYNNFIISSLKSVFIATDNNKILLNLKNKYGEKILTSNTKFYNIEKRNNYHLGNLHQFGKKESDVLIEALIDLLLLASANKIMIILNNSGYSRLARFLCNHKGILNKMLGNTVNSPQV
jgi:hypothetical protein